MLEFPEEANRASDLRVIKTARDIDTINKLAKEGFRPLIKEVERSPEIKVKYTVFQHQHTGEIHIVNDIRMARGFRNNPDYEQVIDFSYYYPYSFVSPFAAYLVPKDIRVGEHVILEDLIEDYIGMSWNQGDNFRLPSCEAIWNGSDFEIQYDPSVNRRSFVG